jgi:polar amino acid transport system substrate-binding protein
MKKYANIMLVLGILLATGGMGYAQDMVVISTFDFQSPNVDVAEKVLTEAYARIGRTMQLRRFPGERAIQTANNGEVDGELIRRDAMSSSYPNLVMIPVPIVVVDFVVFAKDKRFQVNGWDSLAPYNVGYRRGVKTVETNLPAGTYSEAVATLEQAFRKLEAGRSEVVVDTRLGGLVVLQQLGMDDIVVLEPSLDTSPQFHYLHVRHQQLVEPLTEALKQMEDEGLMQQFQQQIIEAASSPSE